MTVVDIVSRARGSDQDLRERVEKLLDADGFYRARTTITGWAGYAPSPLVERPDVAARLGIETLFVKDESQRLGLKSFKSLGGAYAVHRAHQRWVEAGSEGDFVVTCVTDGNHGLSVASGARSLGVRCIIYLPDAVSERRQQAIAELGAEVQAFPGNYDEVTRRNARDAAENGWTIITDTSSDQLDHQSVTDVMQGYRVLAQEIVDAWDRLGATHILLQAGCGGMAGAIVGHLITHRPLSELPTVVIVEPENAACLTESARNGEPTAVTGDLDTMMGGLSCGEVSLPAWTILKDTVNHYVAISDEHVADAMRLLAAPSNGSTPVVSGETGAAGLAALLSLVHDERPDAIGLGPDSRVLLLSTEGDTDPELYASLVAGPASS